MQLVAFYNLTRNLFFYLEPKAAKKMRLDYFNHTASRVDKRLERGSSQPDLWNCVVESNVLTKGEHYANAELFMIAGTETTCKLPSYNDKKKRHRYRWHVISAALLTGLIFYLVKNPDKLRILVDEVRGIFKSNEEMTFEAISKLEYLNACQ
jgi:hypothetical protein